MTTAPFALESFPLPQDLTLHMVHIEGSTFLMGDDEGEEREKPAHEVQVASFQLGQYPVTQALWEAVMGENPSRFRGKDHPVEIVSWYDAVEFCNALSDKMSLEPVYQINKTQKDPDNHADEGSGIFADNKKWLVTPNWQANGFRLPTEAEWEYAAREGRLGTPKAFVRRTYSGSNHLDLVGWYSENSQSQSHAVGLKAPNALGLYDMSGNVYEWCWDWYGKYPSGSLKDPTGPDSGQFRVLRGGSGPAAQATVALLTATTATPITVSTSSGFVSPGRYPRLPFALLPFILLPAAESGSRYLFFVSMGKFLFLPPPLRSAAGAGRGPRHIAVRLREIYFFFSLSPAFVLPFRRLSFATEAGRIKTHHLDRSCHFS